MQIFSLSFRRAQVRCSKVFPKPRTRIPRQYPNLGRICAAFAMALVLPGLASLTGCAGGSNGAQGRSDDRLDGMAREGASLFDPAAAREAGRRDDRDHAGDGGGRWSIEIASFDPDDRPRAESMLEQVRSIGGLTQAYLERRGRRLVIAYGRYEDPGTAEARSDLDRVRAIEVDDGQPFAGALFSPVIREGIEGSEPHHDLRNARDLFGPRARYTLQIGIYGRDEQGTQPARDELAEYRQLAENAARELRGDGHEAFYFHGASSSSVTVGVFDDGDLNPPSALLMQLREEFPNLLLNGHGIRQRIPGRPAGREDSYRLQRSQLVEIPR